MGINASETREIVLNNCEVPRENLLEGEGATIMGESVVMASGDAATTGAAGWAVEAPHWKGAPPRFWTWIRL